MQWFVGVLLAVASVAAAGGSYSFTIPEHIRRGEDRSIGGADAVAVADLDGDGLDDIAALTAQYFSGQSIVLVFQQPGGSLATPVFIDAPRRLNYHLRAVDLDEDGVAELLLGHSHGITVYDFGASAPAAITHHASPVACLFVTPGDIDRDGHLDVYCQGSNGYGTIYHGDGAGLLGPVAMQAPGFTGFLDEARLADVTSDGWLDLLLADAGSNALFVLPGDRGGSFEPAIAYPYPDQDGSWSPTVEVADIDGDDVVEVLVARKCNAPCATIQVMRQGTQGYLEWAEKLQTLDLPTAIIAADIDGNGRVDVLTAHSGWSSIGRYIGRETGLGPTPFFSLAPTSHGPRRYAVGDIDHDGQVDVVIASSFGISLLRGGRVQASDFNGDLVSDITWRHESGHNVVWLAGDATTTLEVPYAAPSWAGLAVGDMDGFQGAEMFWRDSGTGANATWQAGGAPRFITGVASQDWQVVAAGDFDGDGRSDLFWRNLVTGVNTIWLGGASDQQRAVARLADVRWRVEGVGDFDGDGLADVVWRHDATARHAIWHGASSAHQRTLQGVSLDWHVAGIGDFDRDGRDDLAWRNARTGQNAIWRSADATTPLPMRGVSNTNWQIAAVGDYDGDGYSDVFWRERQTGSNVIWLAADASRQQAIRNVRDTRWRVVP